MVINLSIEEELSSCIVSLLMKEPFYAHILGNVVRKITSEIPTLGVTSKDKKIYLLVNEKYFMESLKNKDEKVGAIKHEVLHLILKHLNRKPSLYQEGELWNLAADLVVNQYISPWKLPNSAVTLLNFPDLDLPKEASIEEYFERLNKLKNEMKNSGWGNSDSFDPRETSTPESSQFLQDIFGKERHSDHTQWNDSANSSEETLIDQAIQSAKERAKSNWIHLPSFIKNNIFVQSKLPMNSISWKREIQIFSSACGRTRIRHTMMKISKRYNTRPGIKVQRMKNLLVVLDTSGSISEDTVRMFLSEIHQIWRTGASVSIMESDSTVHKVYPYKGKFPSSITGGGGTDYDAAFLWMNRKLNKQYDGCIYLTDGDAPSPQIKPYCRILWALSGDMKYTPHLKWGRVVKLEQRNS
jgi:predicted metal-dependent peptidase